MKAGDAAPLGRLADALDQCHRCCRTHAGRKFIEGLRIQELKGNEILHGSSMFRSYMTNGSGLEAGECVGQG